MCPKGSFRRALSLANKAGEIREESIPFGKQFHINNPLESNVVLFMTAHNRGGCRRVILRHSNNPCFPLTHHLRSFSHNLLVAPTWASAGRRVFANTRCFGHLAWVGAAGGCHQATPYIAPQAAGCPDPHFSGSNPKHSGFQGCYQAKVRGRSTPCCLNLALALA